MFAIKWLKAVGAGGALVAGFLVLVVHTAAQDGSGSAGASPSRSSALTPALSQGEREKDSEPSNDQVESATPFQTEQAVPVAIDPHMAFERLVVGPDGVVRGAATDEGGVAGGERLIYSNTLGLISVNFPSNQPVSDDIATTAPDGCNLTRFKFKVLGRVQQNCVGGANHGMPCTSPDQCPTGTCPIGGGYRVSYALYTNCPLAVGSTAAQQDLVKIPGTDGQIEFADDAPREITHTVDPLTPVAIPTNVYLGIKFNRSNCGTVVGAPASIGFSGDIWDTPGSACKAYLGGFPELPHASFWLEMFGSDSCADAFVAYKAQRPSGGYTSIGANIQGVDDVTLIVDDCDMIGYEVAVKGVGFYTFDLRRTCEGQIIPGTEKTFQVGAGTVPLLQVARFTFDPPIHLPSDSIYAAFKCSSNSAGTVVAGVQPIIGFSSPDFLTMSPEGCTTVPLPPGVHGAINLAITCAGSLPTGACCDPYLTECNAGADAGKRCLTNADCAAPGTCEAVCRETTDLNCPFPPTGQELFPLWRPGEACSPDPFPEQCGVSACCHMRPDPQNPLVLEHVCVNMTRNECESQLQEPRAPIWQLGQYCGLNAQSCPHVDCIAATGSCYVAHNTPGCSDPYCCSEVCAHGADGVFCCNIEWDSACVALAERCCTGAPPISDQCAPGYPDRCSGEALRIPVPGSRPMSNLRAITDPGEPGFCCNAGTGTCIGGTNDGAKCVVGTDCNSGVCTERVPEPWAQAFGTVWFKFAPPAGVTSVGISTCASNSPALDSIVQVFQATDHSSLLAECNSLVPIGCNDDAANCGSTGRNSRLCLSNLTPGNTYYIELAAKTENRLGQYIVTISTNCSGETPPCTNCPAGEVEFIDPPDGVIDARRPSVPIFFTDTQGIQMIVVQAPSGAPRDCWTACEGGFPSDLIWFAEEDHPGQYTLYFTRPISAGDKTQITYAKGEQHAVTGTFYFHPGNVNGSSWTDPFDILALIDSLNGVSPLPWGRYSGDLDYSGLIGPADILTLIDLLNGASGFAMWNGTPLPAAAECP